MATLQQQVQQYLDNTGISLRELSRRSGVSHTTIGKILRGGTYKSDTAHALYSLISITPISEYVTLHDKVEQLAADRVDHDKGAWDVDLNCAKYRRVMQLEKELEEAHAEIRHVQHTLGERGTQITELSLQLQKRDAELEQAQEDIHDIKTLETESAQFLRDANAEIKRLTALAETHGQSWKAACVQVEQLQRELKAADSNNSQLFKQKLELNNEIEFLKEQCAELRGKLKSYPAQIKESKDQVEQLQKQLDHDQTAYKELHSSYQKHLDDDKIFVAEMDALLAAQDNTATKHDQQVMRLRVYIWILTAALVFIVASGLFLWGAV